MSSRNLKAGTSRSDAGVASETRRCLGPEGEGKGAVKEKVDVCVVTVAAIGTNRRRWGERKRDRMGWNGEGVVKGVTLWNDGRRKEGVSHESQVHGYPSTINIVLASLNANSILHADVLP